MYALPASIDATTLVVTGIACPDCGGVLGARAEGRDRFLVFVCRIEHTYDVAELLAAEEENIEERLWAAVVGLEELRVLLAELAARGAGHGESAAARRAYEERAAVARQQVAALRGMMNASRPVDLSDAQTDGLAPHGQR